MVVCPAHHLSILSHGAQIDQAAGIGEMIGVDSPIRDLGGFTEGVKAEEYYDYYYAQKPIDPRL